MTFSCLLCYQTLTRSGVVGPHPLFFLCMWHKLTFVFNFRTHVVLFKTVLSVPRNSWQARYKEVLIFNWTNVLKLLVCSNVYLWSKLVCLFVLFVFIKSTEPGFFRSASLCLWESSQWEGVHGLGSVTFGLAVQKFLNIEWFLHWKSN
jgi:hypothetical protein